MVVTSCISVCAEDLVPESSVVENRSSSSISVAVIGGAGTRFGGNEEVPIDVFQEALAMSIGKFDLFGGVVGAGGTYALEVTVFPMQPQTPTTGLGIKYLAPANWKLTRTDTGEVLMQQRVDAEHEAISRLRLDQ